MKRPVVIAAGVVLMAMVAAVTVWLSTDRDPARYSGTSAEGAASPSAARRTRSPRHCAGCRPTRTP